MRKLIPIAATALVVAVVAAGYWALFLRPTAESKGTPGGGPPGVVVEATAAIKATSVRKLKAVGTLTSNLSVIIRPEIAGRLVKLGFEDGGQVKKGQVLAVLDRSVLLAELNEARADLRLAEQEYKRAASLFRRGTGTGQRRDQTQAALRTARAKIDYAQARLEKMEIKAPFDGTVGIHLVDIGAYLAAGADIVNLEQYRPIKVDFEVPERYLTDLVVGKEVVLRSEAYPGEIFNARISAIDPRINTRTRSVKVQAQSDNADGKLRPGQFASVTLRVDERRGATFVPEQALVPNSDAPFVFRIEGGVARRTQVKTGTRIARHIEILEGLRPGVTVVTAGQQKLADGAKVIPKKPTFIPPSPPDEEIQVADPS